MIRQRYAVFAVFLKVPVGVIKLQASQILKLVEGEGEGEEEGNEVSREVSYHTADLLLSLPAGSRWARPRRFGCCNSKPARGLPTPRARRGCICDTK